MKRIDVYSPYWSSFGGGEKYLLLLALALRGFDGVRVRLLNDGEEISLERLGKFANADLGGMELVHIGSLEEATRGTHLAVVQSNFRYRRTAAAKTAHVMQIPYAPITPATVAARLVRGELREAAKDVHRVRLMRCARREVDLVVTYSAFVQTTLERSFGLPNEVLAPPIQDLALPGIAKRPIILSVGRFFAGLYNEKRYDVLTSAFRRISAELPGWEYHIAGSARDDRATNDLLDALRRENAGVPLVLHPNLPFADLQRLYNEATIFWHAAGFGVDEGLRPDRMEHFGMSTAEAMSAGCIPVVINRGGQREIVTHGVDGYLWNNLDELATLTTGLARGAAPAGALALEARRRAASFFPDRFESRARALFGPLLA